MKCKTHSECPLNKAPPLRDDELPRYWATLFSALYAEMRAQIGQKQAETLWWAVARIDPAQRPPNLKVIDGAKGNGV